MKNLLCATFSFLCSISLSHAQVIEPDFKKPISYSVVIENSTHNIVYSTYLNNLSRKEKKTITDVEVINNCIQYNGIVQYTKDLQKNYFHVFFNEEDNHAVSIVVDIEKIVSKKKINTGECYIDNVVVGKKTLINNVPFVYYEYQFHLNDQYGNVLPEKYYIKITGNTLINKK